MLQVINIISNTLPGYGPPDGGCLPCSGVSGIAVSASPCSSRVDHRHNETPKVLTLNCASRRTSYVCNANSSGRRRNPDFSRQNNQGFSSNRNNLGKGQQYEDRDGFDNFEDSEMFNSKNGPILTGFGAQKFQATATPGPKEKEIVELFRKVQAQLRDKAARKEEKKSEEEKKIEQPQGKGKESETVDSLLKLLKKHSVQPSKTSDSSNSRREFILDQPEPNFFPEDKNINNLSPNRTARQEKQDAEISVTDRPRSIFRRRSPIHQVKPQPVYSDVSSVSHTNIKDDNPESIRYPELGMESETESNMEQSFSDEEGAFDGMSSEDETSAIYDSEKDEEEPEEHDMVESTAFSEMTVPELRAIAKSRGVKGFSRLKKHELVELLSQE